MAGNNDNRENNKGFLDELIEIFLEGLLAIFGEILGALLELLVKAIGVIIAIGFIIYLIVTFIANHT